MAFAYDTRIDPVEELRAFVEDLMEQNPRMSEKGKEHMSRLAGWAMQYSTVNAMRERQDMVAAEHAKQSWLVLAALIARTGGAPLRISMADFAAVDPKMQIVSMIDTETGHIVYTLREGPRT